jgi:HK97 family phage portal protein
MNFLTKFFNAPEQKASRAYSIHYENLPSAIWSPRTYTSFATTGYKYNVVAFQAINKIASAIASMSWVACDSSGTQVKNSPFLDLINNPNPWQSKNEWWTTKIAYLLLAGECFDERVMLSDSRPSLNRNGMPERYIYNFGGRKIPYEANPITGDSNIRHTRLFNPVQDWTGQSPLEAANFAVNQHNEAMSWLKALLQNSARPSGALMLDRDTSLTDDQYDRLRGEIEENFSGSRNAGRPMLFEGGMKWQEMSLSPADMAIIEQKDSAARDISLAFGVPPLLLNIPGDNTYSNYREARLGFYEDTIIPLVQHVTGELNPWLSRFFGGHRIAPDYDSIEAIAQKRRDLWEMVDASDEISVNEARKLKGFPPLPAPLGSMLMADLRSSRRGHTSDRSNNGNILGDLAYGDETQDN